MKKQSTLIIQGLSVNLRDGNVERALKKFRKLVETDGRIKLLQERRYYIKPSEQKRIELKRAIQKQRNARKG